MIADGPPARVLLFRPDGKVVWVGGVGGGPSEYAYVDDVGFVGDTLWVTDARSSKAVFFDMEGRPLRTQRIALDPRNPFERQTGPIRPLADGAWMASVSAVSITGVLNDWVTTRPWYWVKGDSMILKSVMAEWSPFTPCRVDRSFALRLMGVSTT
jgi:hypothetical protein